MRKYIADDVSLTHCDLALCFVFPCTMAPPIFIECSDADQVIVSLNPNKAVD